MGLAVVTLKKGEGRFLKSGGMWVFDNEIASVMGSFVNGDIVLVHDFDGYPLGRGFINRNSKITVRLLTRNENQKIDEDFFEKRVRDAWEYRKKVTDTSSCRVIFGEADFFPGLVVDKFEDVLVVQSLALGIDRWKELILDLIKKVLAEDGITIRGVYERSDAKVRKQEGMELYKGFIGKEFPTLVEIQENGVRYQVDIKDGQKTGFFLDQKYNRLAIQKLCKDARVLDCFTWHLLCPPRHGQGLCRNPAGPSDRLHHDVLCRSHRRAHRAFRHGNLQAQLWQKRQPVVCRPQRAAAGRLDSHHDL